jgi:hypothetical protein
VLAPARVYGKFTVRDGGLWPGSKPRQCPELSVDDLEREPNLRRVLCRRYENCLTHAASEGWAGFDCGGCDVADPLSLEDQHKDLDGLAEFLCALDLQAGRWH